jgi:hypothetical protein
MAVKDGGSMDLRLIETRITTNVINEFTNRKIMVG